MPSLASSFLALSSIIYAKMLSASGRNRRCCSSSNTWRACSGESESMNFNNASKISSGETSAEDAKLLSPLSNIFSSLIITKIYIDYNINNVLLQEKGNRKLLYYRHTSLTEFLYNGADLTRDFRESCLLAAAKFGDSAAIFGVSLNFSEWSLVQHGNRTQENGNNGGGVRLMPFNSSPRFIHTFVGCH